MKMVKGTFLRKKPKNTVPTDMTNFVNAQCSPSQAQKGFSFNKDKKYMSYSNGGLRVYFDDYVQLDGSTKTLFSRVGDGSIITRFDKTPLPENPEDVVCPHFVELKWGYGCPFDCAWCYLKGTFRFIRDEQGRVPPRVKDMEKVKQHIEAFFDSVPSPEVLNTGELCDSLMWENGRHSFTRRVLPLFEEQDKHKVLFLTKSTYTNNLLDQPHNGQSIVSFTLNAYDVSKTWEKDAPSSKERIEAAKKVYDEGYTTRIRIDPIVPIEDWEKKYKVLIDDIFTNLTPERITLGSLRGLQSTLNSVKNRKDNTWIKYLSERSNWGKKIDEGIRYNAYSTIINYLKDEYSYNSIAMCKETVAMWDRLRMDYKKITCNCIL